MAAGDAAGGAVEPHWWQDPRAGAQAVSQIARVLAKQDPAGARGYRLRARRERLLIAATEQRIAACIGRIPSGRRRIVTDHDAFGAFARRFGIEIVGAVFPATTAQAQSSAGDVAELERTIRREHVSAVFPEQAVSGKLARRIADDTGARIGRKLYGDALGPDGTAAATYTGMLRANARALAAGTDPGGAGCR